MTTTPAILTLAPLPSRGLLRLEGKDTMSFLNNVITQDMALLDKQPALYAALLTPQGKLCHDFFLIKEGDGFLLDVYRGHLSALQSQLEHYRLIAESVIMPDSRPLYHLWGEGAEAIEGGFADPRHAALGRRHVGEPQAWREQAQAGREEDWIDYCSTLGVAEPALNGEAGSFFPHEVNLDIMGAIGYDKGCFIGQEVVSRVKRRGLARRRTMRAKLASGTAEAGALIEAGTAKLGEFLPQRGLAQIRLDRWAQAQSRGDEPQWNGVAVELSFSPLFEAEQD